MKLKAISRNELPPRHAKPGKNQRLLFEFMDAAMDCAEVQIDEGANATRTACSLRTSIKKLGLSCYCIQRKGRIFLVAGNV